MNAGLSSFLILLIFSLFAAGCGKRPGSAQSAYYAERFTSNNALYDSSRIAREDVNLKAQMASSGGVRGVIDPNAGGLDDTTTPDGLFVYWSNILRFFYREFNTFARINFGPVMYYIQGQSSSSSSSSNSNLTICADTWTLGIETAGRETFVVYNYKNTYHQNDIKVLERTNYRLRMEAKTSLDQASLFFAVKNGGNALAQPSCTPNPNVPWWLQWYFPPVCTYPSGGAPTINVTAQVRTCGSGTPQSTSFTIPLETKVLTAEYESLDGREILAKGLYYPANVWAYNPLELEAR